MATVTTTTCDRCAAVIPPEDRHAFVKLEFEGARYETEAVVSWRLCGPCTDAAAEMLEALGVPEHRWSRGKEEL